MKLKNIMSSGYTNHLESPWNTRCVFKFQINNFFFEKILLIICTRSISLAERCECAAGREYGQIFIQII